MSSSTVEFTPVETGDLSEIPPDLPAGCWIATCSVKKMSTSREGFPMLAVEWHTIDSHTPGNEEFVGGRTTDFLVFYPQSHKNSRLSRLRLRGICTATGIEPPSVTSLQSWDDLEGFIEALSESKCVIYTSVDVRRDTGEKTTRVYYTPPRATPAPTSVAF